ncbi:MAG: DeoR/GlpR family DNA-binding transcription regulator [Firmicutes bacterium]|nr:DeoR/GlpR family DNA-binding transcription regulator [Bacillota bacterium]
MLAVERRKDIINQLNTHKSVLVPDLSKKFGVTEETIRRDLEKLEEQGVLIRTYGGAVLNEGSRSEISVEIRQEINIAGKDAIGKAAASLVKQGDTIILDASTSALYVAKHLQNKPGLTVISNSMKVILELANCPEITIISTGGVLRPNNLSYVGRTAQNAIDTYSANKVFFSCKGLTITRGLTDSNEQESDLRRKMIANSDQAIFLCDHTKFGQVGVVKTAGFEEIDDLITDRELPEEWREKIESAGVRIQIA